MQRPEDVNVDVDVDVDVDDDDEGGTGRRRYTCYSGRNGTGRVLNHKDRHNCKLSGGKSWRDKEGNLYNL